MLVSKIHKNQKAKNGEGGREGGIKMLREKLNELNFGKFQAERAHMAGRMREPNKVVT